jgi:hypothetical protein
MSFINTPDLFWNQSSPSVKKTVQQFMFPTGLIYDHETGFGTITSKETHCC